MNSQPLKTAPLNTPKRQKFSIILFLQMKVTERDQDSISSLLNYHILVWRDLKSRGLCFMQLFMKLQYRILCLLVRILAFEECHFRAADSLDTGAATTKVIHISIYRQCQYLIVLKSQVVWLISLGVRNLVFFFQSLFYASFMSKTL